ncbi:hypothetical protein JB92DRAFT_986118 [Gautieria morchelliformis]|nr:hypothetical protein JB92DRAFT_986118 [Gautieria morchelliformis]
MSLPFYPVRVYSVLSLVDELCGAPMAGGRNEYFLTPPQLKVPLRQCSRSVHPPISSQSFPPEYGVAPPPLYTRKCKLVPLPASQPPRSCTFPAIQS